jgi:membrane protease YdiL (CAAX protease family)
MQTASIGFKQAATVPLLVVSVLLEFFLLAAGSFLFGSEWSGYNNIIIIYMVASIGLIIASGTQQEFMKIEFFDALIIFVPVFLLTGFIVGSVYDTAGLAKLGVSYEIAQVLMQIFVVSLTEELIFRGILLSYMPNVKGVVIQGVAFGLFHVAAYSTLNGVSVGALLFAIVLGIFLGAIILVLKNNKSLGLSITWGIHAGYNVAVLTGLFSVLSTVGV